MKRILMLMGVLAFMTVASCKKKEDVPMTPPEAPLATPAPAPAEPPLPEEKTTVKVGTNGVDVESKNTKVIVNPSGTAVEVKK